MIIKKNVFGCISISNKSKINQNWFVLSLVIGKVVRLLHAIARAIAQAIVPILILSYPILILI